MNDSPIHPRRRLVQFSIRVILIVMFAGALFASRYQPKEVSAELEVVSVSAAEKTAVVRLTNTARNEIYCYGYSLTSPFFSVDECNNGQWLAMGIGRCGTGTGFHRIARGSETEFQVFWRDENATAIRVRVSCYARSNGDSLKTEIVSAPIPCRPATKSQNRHTFTACDAKRRYVAVAISKVPK